MLILRCTRGFSLIELMIAMTIGMVVIAGALTFIMTINQANAEIIQSARLNQELRALVDVIAGEIRRARRLHDPISNIAQGTAIGKTFDKVDTSVAGCILYGYQDPTLSDDGAAKVPIDNHRVIRLSTAGGVGSLVLASSTGAVNCSTGGTVLNSPQINITDLTFKCATPVSGLPEIQAQEICNEIDISLTAKTKLENAYATPMSGTYSQVVFIRSGAVKTD
jgi:prepilin-type N-terminal cleavage/methylation domain-containing protein